MVIFVVVEVLFISDDANEEDEKVLCYYCPATLMKAPSYRMGARLNKNWIL